MATESATFVSCGACGRKHEIAKPLVGKPFKCACGSVVLAPVRPIAADRGLLDLENDYDLADEPRQVMPVQAPKLKVPMKAPVEVPKVSADVVLTRMGAIPAPKKLEIDPASIKAQREMEKLAEPSLVRDFAIPIALMVLGLALSFYDVMHGSPKPPAPPVAAVPLVLGRAVGSMVLMLGGILLAVTCFEVSLIGTFEGSIFKLCAIAIAPSALYGICCYAIGDVGGSAVGVLAGVTAYGALFYFLMKLDIKDTAVCVLITWILVSAVNYAIYKYQGAANDSWI